MTDQFEPVNDAPPSGIKILSSSPEKAVISIEAHSGSARAIVSMISGVILVFSVLLGVALAPAGILLIGVGIWFAVWLYKKFVPNLQIAVTKDAVSFAQKNYDLRQWGGFRPGTVTTVTGKKRTNEFTSLDFVYGSRNEETSFQIDSSDWNVSEMINWLNDFIDSYSSQPAPPSQKDGVRKQSF